MSSVRAPLMLLALVMLAPAARGQPVDPYQPAPSPGPRAPASPTSPATPRKPGAPAPQPAPTTPATPGAPAPQPAPTPPATPGAPAPQPGPEAPQDPYAQGPTPQDPQMAERVAQALVARAQQLLDERSYLDAKQLAVEALVKSRNGAAADQARAIIHTVNQQLGIPELSDEPPRPPPKEDVDTTPIRDPTQPTAPVAPPPEGEPRTGRLAAVVHGGLYTGLLGTTIGAFLSSDAPATGAVPVGIAVGAAGALAVPRLVDRLHWTESQVRTVGAGTVWGGMIGGLFGDIAKLDGTTAREVLVAASVGSTLGGIGGYVFTRSHKLTPGDIALVDTLAGIGAAGGVTLGMLMQPVESEAYSLNSVIGITAGVVVGAIAAPQTSTTPRRMLRVAGLSALGGAAPFLLYAAIRSPSSRADERVVGLLSSAGLIGGAYLGFRLTRGMDEGLDTLDGRPTKPADDAPVALIGRSSAGRWGLGGIALAPLSPALAPQRGMALQLVGVAF